MKKWPYQILIDGVLYDAIEHTDAECYKNKKLAPASVGFVTLYKDGQPVSSCGTNFAEKNSACDEVRLNYEIRGVKSSIEIFNGQIDEIFELKLKEKKKLKALQKRLNACLAAKTC